MAIAASSSTSTLFSTFTTPKISKPSLLSPKSPPITSLRLQHRRRNHSLRIVPSVSVPTSLVRSAPDELVESILSTVSQSGRGVSLSKEGHKKVAELAQELQKYCVSEPVKCPLIFGEWDVVYCSNPTSPGGGFRSALARLFIKEKELIQVVEAPDTVRNKLSFSALGYNGEVSLKGKLTALNEEWIKVIFEPPEVKVVGLMNFEFGRESEVQLQITYVDEKIRLGKGSRGSLFVFKRM